MDDKDKKEFVSIIIALAENFNAKITTDGLSLRFEALKEFPLEDIKKASLKILKTRQYQSMPTVADFINQLEGSVSSKAEQQLLIVKEALRKADYSCNFDDPITKKLMSTRWKIGEWGRKVLQEELDKWWPKEFIEAYKNLEPVRDQILIEMSATEEVKKLTDKIG